MLNAISCHEQERIIEAHQLYSEAIKALQELVEKNRVESSKKEALNNRIKEYIDVVAHLDTKIKELQTPGPSVENIEIHENDMGYGYKRVFGKYLTMDVKEVIIRESYLRKKFQFRNLIAILELLVKSCENLKYIRVVTVESNQGEDQVEVFNKISIDLEKRGITFNYQFDKFHDRKILLDSGFLFNMGKGLNYFKTCDEYNLGASDYDFRKCDATTITVFRTKSY